MEAHTQQFPWGVIISIVLFVLIVGAVIVVRIGGDDTTAPTEQAKQAPATTEEVSYTTITSGDGAVATTGDTVAMHYRGYLEDGTEFDSSYDRGTPFEVTLGAGQVIDGWEIGILGMQVGEVRELVIPPQYGYGDTGVPGVIPPGATLVFEVSLEAIQE